jgi:hypothetical protein
MPSLPWTARDDVSPVEDDTSLAALLAGSGLPADAGSELRPVADVLSALTARAGGDELTGLAAAQAEFRRRVVPARVRRSRRWRSVGLVSRLGVRAGAAATVVVTGLGGAAAAAYANALPSSWQQFAHRTIGAPAHRAGHETRATMGAVRPAARPAAHPGSHHPAYQQHSGGSPARYGSPPHTRPPLYPGPRTARPFMHRGGAPTGPVEGRWPPLSRRIRHWREGTEQSSPGAGVSNARSMRGVS